MPNYVTREEFEVFKREVMGEVEGEKTVTRHILTETCQNSGDLAIIKAQITHLSGDLILANAALKSHGTRLNVLTQDVREIRTRLDGMDARIGGMDAKLDAVLTAIRALAPRGPPVEI